MSNNLKFVHPKAQKALKLAFKESNLKLVVVQTMSLGGNDAVKASAGTHNQAGTYRNLFGINIPYSSCIDLSVNQEATRISDGKAIKLDETHIKWVLMNLAQEGFCGWFRTVQEGFSAQHIHVCCPQAPISGLPLEQVLDFLTGKDGLRYHRKEEFYSPSEEYDKIIVQKMLEANPHLKDKVPQKFRV